MPRSSIRNGYSLVPWTLPRYLTMRRRRVETWSSTRWSSRMTQSETYSSSPWRVSVPSPRSPVMTAVTPLSLSQRNSRRSSARRIAWFRQAAEERLDGVEHHALGADRVDGVAQADEQPFEVVLAGLLDLAALDVHVVDDQLAFARPAPSRSKPSERTFCVSSSVALLERHEHARLAELRGAAHQELHGQQRLAAAGAAADQRRPAARQAAPGDLVEAGDAGGGLFDAPGLSDGSRLGESHCQM